MHAFLMIGRHHDDRTQKIQNELAARHISPFDTVTVPDAPTIGIADIREFIAAIAISPMQGSAKAGVIPKMERLTLEAQNALLKTLEEPPPGVYIFAETQNPDILLPTIVSRFAVIPLGTHEETEDKKLRDLVRTCLHQRAGEILAAVDQLATDREAAQMTLTRLTDAARQELIDAVNTNHPDAPKLAAFVRSLMIAQSQLLVHVNPKLVFDIPFLQLV